MKAVILAGGLGSRLSEETTLRPKPMVEVGGKPVLWHILKNYSHHGINDFVICLGYRGYVIKEYFANYFLHTSDVTFNLRDKKNQMEIHQGRAEPWKITLVDTGDATLTAGRLKRVREHLGDEDFCFTYGDGVGDVNITELIKFHKAQEVLVTLTATRPPGRFGALALGKDETKITSFREKPDGDGAWINGGYFVVNPKAIDLIDGDETTWEREPLERLASTGNLAAFRHSGFWQPMDTLHDKNNLEKLWATGKAPWKVW